jgi:uncharacterized spore protein YtfJ
MQAREILAQARDAMNARRVFGEPIDRDGVTVIPVMRLMGGAGGGGGEENASLGGAATEVVAGAAGEIGGEAAAAAVAAGGEAPGGGLQGAAASFGVGFGVKASPAGVYVIKGDDVRWLPAVEPERLALIGGVVGVISLLVLRSIVRAALKR